MVCEIAPFRITLNRCQSYFCLLQTLLSATFSYCTRDMFTIAKSVGCDDYWAPLWFWMV